MVPLAISKWDVIPELSIISGISILPELVEMVLPSILILSTVKAVKVPSEVTLV